MKRAAMLILAIATLVLLGAPSISRFDSSCYAGTGKTTTGPGVIAPVGGTVDTGGPAGGGGSGGGADQGDGDGLSGLKITPGGRTLLGAESGAMERVRMFVEMWWMFRIWMR